jgi:hypothetical protein
MCYSVQNCCISYQCATLFSSCVCVPATVSRVSAYGTMMHEHSTNDILHCSVPSAFPSWRLHLYVCALADAICITNTLLTTVYTMHTAAQSARQPLFATAHSATHYQLLLHCNGSAVSIVLLLLLLAGRCQCREGCTEPHIPHKQPQLRQRFTSSYTPLQ